MNEIRSDGSPMFYAFIVGAVIGATLGVLFAPKTGAETREQLAEFARKTREKATAFAGEARQKMGA